MYICTRKDTSSERSGNIKRSQHLKLLIQFPTRARPDKFFEVLNMYRDFADNWDDIRVHVVCNVDDTTMNNCVAGRRFLEFSNLRVTYAKCNSKIEAVNYGAGEALKGYDVLMLASDDMLPRVQGYDARILRDMEEQFPDTDGMLWYNDGHKGEKLCSLSILGRKYYERFGYIYHPAYNSFFCDNEFAEVATALGKKYYCADCIIEHAHPDYHLCRTDKLYKYNLRYHGQDKGTYARRKSKGFPVLP